MMELEFEFFSQLARGIIQGKIPDYKTYQRICALPEQKVFALFPGANILRQHFHTAGIHLCTICNAKSGKCSEDCCFCSQSVHHQTEIKQYPLLSSMTMLEKGLRAANSSINRFSLVTSGRGLASQEVDQVAQAISGLRDKNIATCVSLGILDDADLDRLRKAGLSRYHHNLETAASHFPNICSTHSYAQRLDMVRRAKNKGLSVCSGGIFGLGETEEQSLELALSLKELDVDAVPLNFLTPIPGTPVEDYAWLTPLNCLKIISLFRYVLPDKQLIVCAGRKENIKDLHPLIYYAGASGVMTGDYLTTQGLSVQEDLELLKQLGLKAVTK